MKPKSKNKLKKKTNARGFRLYEFTDHFSAECSLQKSSMMEPEAIWLGVNKAPTDIPNYTRMHLTQDMVKQLLPALKHFAKHGELP